MIKAKVICDSISHSGVRLTTLELQYHRFVHSEMMTHRMLSRNASSSRAIPTTKMLEQIRSNPAVPIHWGKNQPGMQAREEIECPPLAQDVWKYASELAVDRAYELTDLDVHKQITNRLLEPFQWIKVIVTATEWDNFFALRLHKDAQPEMMVLAEHMKKVMDESIPVELQPGDWHLPYVDLADFDDSGDPISEAIKCSVARCARIAVLKHDGTHPSIEDDLKLYNRLVGSSPEHASPCEHIATPMDFAKDTFELAWENGVTHKDRDNNFWSGNLRGFIQYRQLLNA